MNETVAYVCPRCGSLSVLDCRIYIEDHELMIEVTGQDQNDNGEFECPECGYELTIDVDYKINIE